MFWSLLRTGCTVAACLLPMLGLAATQFVASPPLSQVVRVPVGEVAAGPVQVPIITWGGDIATILANGNEAATTPDSLLGKAGFRLQLKRQDVFARQLADYLAGRSPYLRGTLGMITLAAEAAARDPRTRPVVIHQLTWSAGGDALVVKPGIRTPRDLKGKTIALQAYGPHVDYMAKILADAGLSPTDVHVRWLSDLTGTPNTPGAALREGAADAAFVISTDALVLTSGGTEGTGSGDSVRGARVLLTTRTANRVIADVYAVRTDYLRRHHAEVEQFVAALTRAQDELQSLVAGKAQRPGEFKTTFGAAALLLLDNPQAQAEVESLYADAELARLAGNVDFFARRGHPRGLAALTREIQFAFVPLGLMSKPIALQGADWDFARLLQHRPEDAAAAMAEASALRMDAQSVNNAVAQRVSQGKAADGELFSFEVLFKPNQHEFAVRLYEEAFKRVVSLASAYAGALLTIDGHTDPSTYLQAKKAGASPVELERAEQSARSLSLARAAALRDALIAYAHSQGVTLDPGHFALLPRGFSRPRSGTCGDDPCAPKTEQEWLSNMRAEFRLVQMQAESSTFKPLE